ncbi:phage holin family protein [Xenorhabdus taiwanensis]|uniref:Phage holin family protein n=1 Tax=Xenorhabdus taiwanensis TaxID=3085177 RepID=A0ABN7C0M5_9GAMM|nr:phage holin family protein [Xenorhabdus sp. TCT-1]
MTQSSHAKGLGKGLFDIVRRVAAIAVHMVETRIQLVAIELEEGMATLVQLLLLVGLTLLLAGFGLMCLLALIFWVIDPAYRIMAIAVAAGMLLLLTVFSAIWTIKKARKLTFLNATRTQLHVDRKMLEDDSHE